MPIVIWVVKSESRVISRIAKQAILLNVVVFALSLAFFALALTIILFPVSVLGWIVIGIAALALPIVGAIKSAEGILYRYPLIGNLL